MKYVWYWEWKWEELEKETELVQKFQKEMEKNPDQFPKMLTNTCFTGRCKGFRLIEADNEEQLMNLVALWWPTENWKLVAYIESGETWQKISRKWMQP